MMKSWESAEAGTSAAIAGEDMHADGVRADVVEAEVDGESVREDVSDTMIGAGISH